MRKPFATMLALVLMLSSIPLGVHSTSAQPASAYVPPLPTPLAPTPSPATLGISGRPLPTPPPPGDLSPEIEEVRVRQVAQAVLDKYTQYYGPRYAMTMTEAAVEGEWAYAVAEPEGVDGESLTLLAHQETGGEWQALMPGSDGLYLQWVDAIPESLVPAGEKSQLRTQAAEADISIQSQVTPVVPSSAEPIEWSVYENQDYGFSIEYPGGWTITTTLVNSGKGPGVIERRMLFVSPTQTGVNIDIFPNSNEFDLQEWFNTYQAGYIPSDELIQRGLMVAGEPAIYCLEPSETPSLARHTVVLLHNDRAYRIEYQADEGGLYLDVYRRMLGSLTYRDGTEKPDRLFDLDGTELRVQGVMGVLDQDCCGYHDPNYNPYPCSSGNCTWWARYKRPDTGGQASPYWGNAANWTSRAAEEGFTVNSTPATGALGATPCSGYVRPGWENHVAYIESFNGSTISFSDMDYGEFNCSVDYWNQSNWSGIEFIHGQGGTCSAPSLIEPSDGAVLSSNTVTFRWNAVSGCTFNGYTFRVCTSPDVDNLSNCFIDTGEGGTQRTETINGHDNQDLYWGARAANAPNGANWAVRRFRIEPSAPPSCNPNADQVALYADTNYGGNCVTLGVGDYPNPGYLGSLGNDNAESIKVGSNVQAILYEHDNYGGRSETFTGDDSNLGDNTIGANVVSSVKVQWRAQPPAAPTLQSPSNGATFNEGQGINLSWSATGSEYYGEIWGGPGGTLTFGWQSGTSRDIGSQWAGYTYSWHVKARNGTGESGWSSTWTFIVKPAAPSNLSAQTVSCSQVNLYWNDNSGNEEGYKVYRNGSYVGQVGMNATSYQDTGLGENTSYSYYVRAFRGSIESDSSNTVNVTTPPCAPPQPDLRPCASSGYPYPVVPSSIQGTHEVNTLYAGQPTYFDWHFINSGNATASGDFHVELWVGGTRYMRYPFSNWGSGWVSGFDDWREVISTPGWHTVRLVTDPDNTIAESDETNNAWEQQFYWTPSAPYADNMESGTDDWTATSLWHQVGASSPYPASHSWSHSWWYGQDSTGNYDTGAANLGDLTSPPVYIPSTGYYLRFWYRYETETQGASWDQRWVQISVDGGPFDNVLQLSDDPMNWWLQSPAINLSGYAGHTVQVRFHFDTLDSAYNAYRGWYVDDFDISTTPPPGCADGHEPNNTPAQATPIAYGQILSADICPGGDYDFYTFTGAAGDKVVIDIDAKVNGSLLDSYILLLDSDGTSVLRLNDDEPTSLDSKLGYQLPHDGTYYVKVKAWNHPSVGGTDYFYTIHLLTDGVNPSAAITSPGSDAWLDPTLETITVAANDDESGINRVEFLWHDADWENSNWVWLGADYSSDDWSWNFDTGSLPEQRGGAFYVWAFDWVGNWTGAGVWNLGIDHTPPTAAASVSPMYGNAPFRDFHVWWYGSDNLSGVAGYDVQYRDGPGGAWTDLLTATTDTYYRFVGLDGHTCYFRARARDNAGNQGTYAGGDGDAQYTVDICDTAPDAYEADNAAGSARWITTDGISQTHNIHAEGDQDWVRFYAAAGVTYTLVTTNTGGHADTVLYLYGTDGSTLIDSNDDYPGMWPASRLDWQPSASGTYYAMVNHWDQYAYGCTTGYGLTILTNDESPPTGSVSINNGAVYAASMAVMLTLAGADVGTGVGQVMASNSSSFGGATWVSYATSLNWTLTAGDGTKTVYVRFRDRAGNESTVYSDTIVLDTTAPTGSVLIQGGAEVVTDTQVVLTLSASDAHGVTHVRLRNDTAAWGAWEPFATSRTWALPAQPGERMVWVQFRDPAGNVSAAYSDSVAYQFPHRMYLPLIACNR